MDSLTQAALGAAIGGTVLGHRLGRKAVLIGAVLGTLPDLDVVIDYGDAVANYTQHRGFSHSLFVLGGLASLLALLCTRFAPARDITFRHWWLFFGLCLMTHPLLDALTTYGTQIWWPLDVRPSAWPVVFIIDPLYSLPLLVGAILALITGHGRRAPAWGLAISCAYLAFSMGAKSIVESRIAPVLAAHELREAPRLVQPTPFNVLLWRVTVIDANTHHEALVGIFDGDYRPPLESYTRGAELEDIALAMPKGARLDWFSGPYLRYDDTMIDGTRTLVATDLRLGFPGFHPFSFALAEFSGGEDWQPIVTYQLDTSRSDNGVALSRLFHRILAPEPPLCTSDFVERRWVVSRPKAC
ncbi:integral membrane protein [Litchfieldella qijiaojingensis]|uniref:Integral membrane protein n=1 Tax=Litchfieldella qijiaojingensis TaxID=980347 RepID=A0ABQ2YUH1_9GAMM|nr:metal-dependent hydrolase [Halomonas qijiaojingensis]GGX94474.1 integral membrane protein [Halomonas qijiaojingensis]